MSRRTRAVGLSVALLAFAAIAQDLRPRRRVRRRDHRAGRPGRRGRQDQDRRRGHGRGSEGLVDRVEFLVGDEVVFVDGEAPYETYFDFGEESKTHIVQAVAYHQEGVSVTDAVVTRKLPFVTIEQVNRVILWITATDKQGDLVTDLGKDSFRVFENGRPQTIIDFYREDRPITMAILLDSSGSMEDKVDEVHEAAGSFVDTLRDQDRALLIDFDDRVFLIQELTADRERLKAAIRSTEPIGATALYDALHAAYRKIGEIEGRKAIVLLSDGEDTASQFGFDRVLEEAKSSSTIIYGIAIGAGDRSALKDFAEMTGGRYLHVKKADELAGVYQTIAEELRAQYYLTYATDNEEWNGRWMQIRVESDAPAIELRARKGYFAVRGAGGGIRRLSGIGSSPRTVPFSNRRGSDHLTGARP